MGTTLFEKIWAAHLVDDDPPLIYIDLHLVHEVTSPQAFDGLRLAGRKVRRTDLTVATMDHNVPTTPGPDTDLLAKAQLDALAANCESSGCRSTLTGSGREESVRSPVGPELRADAARKTIVCGDSHTSTHGAFGALAFGIGTSEVEHVLATQCLVQNKPKTMLVRFVRTLPLRRDGEGHGARRDWADRRCRWGWATRSSTRALRSKLSMEGRMTICNMSIEWGAKAGMVAPDETTFEYLPIFRPRKSRFASGAS